MKALTNYYNEEDICPNALLAGVDMLLYPNDNLTCFNSLKEAVENGTISEERINESLRKILTLKVNNIYYNDEEYLDSSYLNSEKHQEIINSFN
jgi:beta-N-acetylhexosaminidase